MYKRQVKEWYDGYRFGNVEVYCPWDVINYCDLLKADSEAHPQDYWSNTSGNAMAVSYTHLDVYKRQALWGCFIKKNFYT